MVHLGVLDVAIIVGYFILMVIIGIWSRRKIHNMDDYYMGGRRFGKLLMIMFGFGLGSHADTAVGVAAQSYKIGMAGIWYQWLHIFNIPVFWLLAAVFRRARCLTTGDFYEKRYGPSVGILYGAMGVIINIGYLGVMLFGSGRLIEGLTGGAIPLVWSIGLMTAAFVFYSLVGGLIAAVWNDLIQGLMTVIMSFLLVPFVWSALGGAEGVRIKIPDLNTTFSLLAAGQIGLFWIVMAHINQLVSVVAQPHVMANTAAGKREIDGRIGFCGGAALKRFCTIAWAFVGVLAIGYYGQNNLHGDHVFGSLVRDLLPSGFSGLMIACIMASVMDNGAAFMLTSSALFTRNVMRGFRHVENPPRELLISRVFALIFVAGSLWLAFSFADVPAAIRFMWQLVPLIGVSFWLGLFWRRANRYGAWASFLGSTVALLLGHYYFDWSGDAGFPKVVSFYLSAGLLCGAAVSLLTSPEPEMELNRFFLTINTPVGQEAKLEAFEQKALASGEVAKDLTGHHYKKLVNWRDWEIPVPDKEAVAGFFAFLGISLALHFMLLGLCWFIKV
ncbi:MAG: sodium:solute symporter family protein [Acidobacteria bacterium]|nr:sodium:solute symporter family protein [Acidobacteriota bacterium]